MDEMKAFRQIAVHPDHRRISIIAVYDPCLEKVAFFIMKGHPFGLTASVFNFNRTAHALKWVLSRLFLLLCLNFYDDHFGFCKNSPAEAECDLVKTIFHLLGVTVNEKFQWGNRLNLLGITYSFSEEKLLVLRERKEALIQEILDILSSGSLAPGEAAKLHGKLGFVSGHLSGRHGRSCLLALSERQYARDGSSTVTLPIRRACDYGSPCWTPLTSHGLYSANRITTPLTFWYSPMAVVLTLDRASRVHRRPPGSGGCVSRSRVPGRRRRSLILRTRSLNMLFLNGHPVALRL